MATQDDKHAHVLKEETSLSDTIRIVSFKEGYLDKLVEAEALLEVVGKMVTHHDDVEINSKAFMGISILLEKITSLIDINDNLLPDNAPAVKAVLPKKLNS